MTADSESASSIQETILSPESKDSGESSVVELHPGMGTEAIAIYNAAAARRNWVVARGPHNDARKKLIKARLREHGLRGWQEQVLRAEQTPFLGGASERGWRMDIDFFAAPRGWTAVAEGKYDRAKPQTHTRNGIRKRVYL